MKPNDELLQKIGMVRNKWKAFLWIRGLAWVLGVTGGLAADRAGARQFHERSVLDRSADAVSRSSSRSSATIMQGACASAAARADRCSTCPVRRREESRTRRPSGQRRRGDQEAQGRQGSSSFLLIKDALDRTKNVRFGEQINKRKFSTFAALTGALRSRCWSACISHRCSSRWDEPACLRAVFDPPAVDSFKIDSHARTTSPFPRAATSRSRPIAVRFRCGTRGNHTALRQQHRMGIGHNGSRRRRRCPPTGTALQSSGSGPLLRRSATDTGRTNSPSKSRICLESRSSITRTTIRPIPDLPRRRKRTHPT